MTSPEQPPVGHTGVDLYEERLRTSVAQYPYRRLRVAKRVVVEQRTVTIDVRREELVVEELGVDTDATLDTRSGQVGAAPSAEPLVLVLSREVPDQVLLRTEPVEVVRVHVDRQTVERNVSATVAREQAEVRETPTPGA